MAAKLYGQNVTDSQFIAAWGWSCLSRYDTSKVLPSLPICQAILESGWGSTYISTKGNYHAMNWYNDSVTAKYKHFTVERAPQEVDGKIVYCKEEFCEFDDIQQELECLYNWYNRDKEGYKKLHGCTDALQNFIYIREAGYATDSSYTAKLTRIYLEHPEIATFDAMALEGTKVINMTGQELANAALAVYANKEHYTYCQGAVGELAESERVKNLYLYFRKTGYDEWVKTNKGKQCFDCNNFINYLLGYTTSMYSTENFYNMEACPDIKNAPAGTVLCMQGHVGLSVGNGYFVDFYAYDHTCRKGKIADALFTKACYIKGVKYGNASPKSISAKVLGEHYVGDILKPEDFEVKVTMSDGTVLKNPVGWAATPLALTNTVNVIAVVYAGLVTYISVEAKVKGTFYGVQVPAKDKDDALRIQKELTIAGYSNPSIVEMSS